MENIKGVKFELSCEKCGGTVFENDKQPYIKIDDDCYVVTSIKVKCRQCGLVDYVENLNPKVVYSR